MKLPPSYIESFQQLWHSEFGEKISKAEAEEHVEKLLDCLDLLNQ